MTLDERNQLFDRIHALQQVDIDHALERGKDYLVERLMDCRRRQDEIGQIAVSVKRALWDARSARRNAKLAATLSKSPADADLYHRAEDEYDELKALDESVGVCRATLKAADSDIRLAAGLLATQVYLGQPGTPVETDTATPVVQTPSEAPATTPDDVFSGTVEDLFASTTPVTHDTTRPASTGTIPPGRPPSATILTDPSTVIDLDSLLA